MSLHIDPNLIIESLKRGALSRKRALREIGDLEAEISSGIYTIEQLGLSDLDELRKLASKSKVEN